MNTLFPHDMLLPGKNESGQLLEDLQQLMRQLPELEAHHAIDYQTRLQEAIEKARYLVLPDTEARCLIAAGRFAAMQQNDFSKAVDQLTDASYLLKEVHDIRTRVQLSSESSRVYHFMGLLEKAHEVLLDAIRLYENIPSHTKDDKLSLAKLYTNLSVIYQSLNNVESCEDFNHKAIDIANEISNDRLVLICNSNLLGLYNTHYSSYEKAEEVFHKLLSLFNETTDKRIVAAVFHNGAVTHSKLDQIDKAIAYAQQSITLKEQLGLEFETYQSRALLGSLLMETNDRTAAYRLLKDCETYFYTRKLNHDYSNVLYDLAVYYEKENQLSKSLDYTKKYYKLKEEIEETERSKRFIEAKTKFELEQKEKEAEIFRLKNVEIADYVRQLEVSNEELKQFAHVASHDLREPLRMISSYMGLLDKKLGDRLTESEKEFLRFAVDGANRMDGLINSLLSLAKVGNNANDDWEDMDEILTIVKFNLHQILKERNAVVKGLNLPMILLDKTQAVQLFQNLVANAVKYNKSPQPTVTISYHTVKGKCLISVEDNGIGIHENDRERVFKLFQRAHSDNFQGTGIGLSVVKKITDRIGGSISIEANHHGGSTFILEVPAPRIRKK